MSAVLADYGVPLEVGEGVAVLVVDDNVDHRELIRLRLEPLGITVTEAESGEEALSVLDGVDLVLCDYRLPGIDGLQTLAAIRAFGGPSVIIVTGMGSETVAVEALRAGAIDYLVKDANYLNAIPQVVARAWRHHDLAQRAAEMQRLAMVVSSAVGRAEMLAEIVQGARRLLRASACALYLVRDGSAVLELVDGEPIEVTDVGAAVQRRLNGAADPDDRAGSHTHVIVPLPSATGPVGALVIANRRSRRYAPEELELAESFASFAGIALVNLERLVERTAALKRLALSERRFRQAFDNAPIGMALVDLKARPPGRILELNQALCRITGRSVEALLGGNLAAFVHADDRLAEHEQLESLVSGQLETARLERRYLQSDGQTVSVEGSVSAVTDPDGRPLYAIVQVEDVTARRAAEARLQALALHDTVTGLPNRVLLLDRVEQALLRRSREGHVALLFIDLDRFKHINDRWGHDVGDALLAEVAARLRGVLRPDDTAARLGGDEFVVLCEGLSGQAEAEHVAQRIAAALSAPYLFGDGVELTVTASIGVCLARDADGSPETLLRKADTAMYRAKARGKARYEVFEEHLGLQADWRVQIEQDLSQALAAGQLLVQYQPAFELGTRRIRGVEALVRWDHPERGLLLPHDFIPVAEDTGLIMEVGEFVLREACQLAAGWPAAYPGQAQLQVWVNVSGRQVADGQLAGLVSRVLGETGLAPENLCLELTESVLLDASVSVVADFRALRAMGVALAIDDFGTGYASMSYLTQFPVDILKIDKSFVQRAVEGSHEAAIVEAVARLGRSLNLTVVAEGVETAAQLDWLAGVDCDLVQGHYLARPCGAADLADLLRASAAER